MLWNPGVNVEYKTKVHHSGSKIIDSCLQSHSQTIGHLYETQSLKGSGGGRGVTQTFGMVLLGNSHAYEHKDLRLSPSSLPVETVPSHLA